MRLVHSLPGWMVKPMAAAELTMASWAVRVLVQVAHYRALLRVGRGLAERDSSVDAVHC
jgi:hypothetical protein